MKMALKSKGSDSEVQVDKKKSGGGDAESQSGAELEGQRNKFGQLAKQRVAAAKEEDVKPASRRHEAATRAIEEARKKRGKKSELYVASLGDVNSLRTYKGHGN